MEDKHEEMRKELVELKLKIATDVVAELGYPINKAGAVLRYCEKVFAGSRVEILTRVHYEDVTGLIQHAAKGYDEYMEGRRGPFAKFGKSPQKKELKKSGRGSSYPKNR